MKSFGQKQQCLQEYQVEMHYRYNMLYFSDERRRRLFDFEALKCRAYLRAAFKGERRLFQSKKSHVCKIFKTLLLSFSQYQKMTVIMIHSLIYSRNTSYFCYLLFVYLFRPTPGIMI